VRKVNFEKPVCIVRCESNVCVCACGRDAGPRTPDAYWYN